MRPEHVKRPTNLTATENSFHLFLSFKNKIIININLRIASANLGGY